MAVPLKASSGFQNDRLAELPAPDRLLFLLKWQGPSTTAALGARLGITAEAARQQLQRLHAEGLVNSTSRVRGRGRPLQIWELTRAANRRFPDRHAELCSQLLDTIRKTLGERTLRRLLAARTQQEAGNYEAALSETKNVRQRLERLASLRSAEGYMAECRAERGGFLLIENHCPLCAASGACLELCGAEQELFARLLGSGVSVRREEHMNHGSRRCVYRIQPARAGKKRGRTSPAG